MDVKRCGGSALAAALLGLAAGWYVAHAQYEAALAGRNVAVTAQNLGETARVAQIGDEVKDGYRNDLAAVGDWHRRVVVPAARCPGAGSVSASGAASTAGRTDGATESGGAGTVAAGDSAAACAAELVKLLRLQEWERKVESGN